MSGPLDHSPADILRHLLVDLGYGVYPTAGDLDVWPIHSDQEPNTPDRAITVYNTAGRDDGRIHTSGRMIEHHGFQVRIRDTSSNAGFAKAREVAVALDENIRLNTVTIGSSEYLVYAVSCSSDVLPLPRETPSSQRYVFTVNGTVTIRQTV